MSNRAWVVGVVVTFVSLSSGILVLALRGSGGPKSEPVVGEKSVVDMSPEEFDAHLKKRQQAIDHSIAKMARHNELLLKNDSARMLGTKRLTAEEWAELRILMEEDARERVERLGKH